MAPDTAAVAYSGPAFMGVSPSFRTSDGSTLSKGSARVRSIVPTAALSYSSMPVRVTLPSDEASTLSLI